MQKTLPSFGLFFWLCKSNEQAVVQVTMLQLIGPDSGDVTHPFALYYVCFGCTSDQ
jgi:hypothetical protein